MYSFYFQNDLKRNQDHLISLIIVLYRTVSVYQQELLSQKLQTQVLRFFFFKQCLQIKFKLF